MLKYDKAEEADCTVVRDSSTAVTLLCTTPSAGQKQSYKRGGLSSEGQAEAVSHMGERVLLYYKTEH